ncbi:alpha/beta fold hydrolase [Bacillus sp. KH172YL63]|uniref:alpha/beta fold hydrolase n=1 Tax=Bacillus sp. KH172YL63 TaxID=2709784 RepID=UPI001563E0C3|nr:alpha/beta hydrolase [Bacillus sp. KH172YL63]
MVRGTELFAAVYGHKNNRPTVVLDAGYGDYSKAWHDILPGIKAELEVVAYDRAGLGKSGGANHPRTSDEMVTELNLLLTEMKIEPPYLLVGHSFGGINMRAYATKHPEKVSGLILIDSTPEDYIEKFLPVMPEDFQARYYKQFTLEGSFAEFQKSLHLTGRTRKTLDLPVIILAAGNKAHYTMEAQSLWNEMQKGLLSLSKESELIMAENSTHYIQRDEPELVIEAIKKLAHA